MLHVQSQKVLESTLPNPLASLQWLRSVSTIAAIAICFGVVFLNHYALFLAAYLPVTGWAWFFANKRLRAADQDHANLYKNRWFTLDAPKVHPDDERSEKADAKKAPDKRIGKWWRQPGPSVRPIICEETVYLPNGKTKTVSYFRREVVAEHRDKYRQLAAFLKKQCPPVYAVMSAWWEEFFADKVANEIYPGKLYKDLSADAQRLVRSRTEAEFYLGCFIALRPVSWGAKVDRRPYYRAFAALRTKLRKDIRSDQVPSGDLIEKAPWHDRPRRNWLYVGEGYPFEDIHAIKLHYWSFTDRKPRSKLARKVLAETIAKEKTKTSEWAYLGIGWREMAPVWTHYDRDLPQHSIVAGGSGFGKTRIVEGILLQGIYNGSSVTWLDPKVDRDACSLIAYHAMLAGREDQLVFLSVSRPDIPYNSSFNPLAMLQEPSQVGDVLASMLPADAGANQYFLEEAKTIGRIVGSTCFWLNKMLGMLSDGDDLCWHPPRLVLWLEYARLLKLHQFDDKDAGAKRGKAIAAAQTEFATLFERLYREDRRFVAANEVEEKLFIVWTTPEYTARYWRLHFGHLNDYALNYRWRLVSWVVRVLFPYVCAADERFIDPLFPRSDTLELVSGVTAQPQFQQSGDKKALTLLELYERSGPHLLERDALIGADRSRQLWAYLYEVMVDPGDLARIQVMFREFGRVWKDLLAQARRPVDEYGQAVANLRAPVTEIIAGAKYDLVCDSDPHLSWQRIHKEKLIVILALGSMSDQKASDAVSRAFTQTLLAYGGHIQDHGGADMDLMFGGDEMFSWANEYWASVIDKLRGCGVRTFGLCQSEAGMRHAIGSADLFKHILTSTKNRYTCATQSKEDAEAFVDQVRTVKVYIPQRSVNENPALGNSGSEQVSDWSVGESWTWQPSDEPLLKMTWFGELPAGVFFRRVQKEVHIFIAPQYKKPPLGFMELIGMDRSKARALVEGIDYLVDAKEDVHRLKTWGSVDRFETIAEVVDTAHLEEFDQSIGKFPEPTAYQQISPDPVALGLITLSEQAAVEARGASGLPEGPSDDSRMPINDLDAGSMCEEPDDQPLLTPGPQSRLVPVEEVDPEGNVHQGLRDDSGHRVGQWTVRNDAGMTIAFGDYRKDRKAGPWHILNEQGEEVRSEFFEDGDLVSTEPLPFAPPAPSEASSEVADGGPDQVVKKVDEDGLIHEGRMADGKKEGSWAVRRADGSMAELQHFRGGRPNGRWERYDNEGMLLDIYEPLV